MDYMLSPRIQEQTRGKELCNFSLLLLLSHAAPVPMLVNGKIHPSDRSLSNSMARRPKDPSVWFWRVVMYESVGWFLSPGANILISRMTSAAYYSTAVLCASLRLGVAEGKGGVMRYGDVFGGKQLNLFKAKSSLMEGAGGTEGQESIWSDSLSYTHSFEASHSLSPQFTGYIFNSVIHCSVLHSPPTKLSLCRCQPLAYTQHILIMLQKLSSLWVSLIIHAAGEESASEHEGLRGKRSRAYGFIWWNLWDLQNLLSCRLLNIPWSFCLLTNTSYPSSSPTEGIVPWLGALILEFRSIMDLMMSAGEASQISRGTSGGGQTGEETLNCKRVTCPHSERGKREDNASGILCFHSVIIKAHAYCACTSGKERERDASHKDIRVQSSSKLWAAITGNVCMNVFIFCWGPNVTDAHN